MRLRSASRKSGNIFQHAKSRSIAFVVTAGLIVTFAGSSASAAEVDPTVSLTITGTIENVSIDNNVKENISGTPADHTEDGEVLTEEFLNVNGVLHELPDSVVVPEVTTGQEVVVTLTADESLDAAKALELATDETLSTDAVIETVVPTGEVVTSDTAVLGNHTLTILPVSWTTPDVTTTALTTLGNSVSAYWNEQSAGRVTTSVTVKPWATIANPTTCNSSAIYNAAMTANPGLAAPSLTNHILVYFPKYNSCPFAGRATVFGGTIWVNGYTFVDVTAHEFGHNLGLGHANTAQCTLNSVRVPFSDTCAMEEYNDYADVMGISTNLTTGNLNAAMADSLGFAQVTTVAPTTTTPVVINLSPLSQINSLRAAKIAIPSGGEIYIDYRPYAGRDVRVPASAGVQVHYKATDSSNMPTTYLLDMRPTTSNPFDNASMALESKWSIPDTNLAVYLSTTGSTAKIYVGALALLPEPPDKVAPVAPTVSGSLPVLSTTSTINWTSSPNAFSYTLYRSNRGVETVLATLTEALPYTDNSLTRGEIYTYSVVANSSGGSSVRSNVVSLSSTSTQVDLIGYNNNLKNIFSFTGSQGATGYRLYRSGTTAPVYSGANAAYTDTVTAGQTYTYYAVSYNANGNSEVSNQITLTSPGVVVPPIDPPVVPPTVPPSTKGYIICVYKDLFSRTPDPTGLAGWTSALDSGTARVEVANAITYSQEYRSGLINGAYNDFLGRNAEPSGMQSWLTAMGNGMTIQQMESGFLASAEYYAQNGSNDAQWVRRLYAHVLGRSAGASEVQFWVNQLAIGRSRQDVSMGFLISTERLTTVVDGYYVKLLGRHIDPVGQQSWVSAIQNGARTEAIIGGIIASPEYYNQSNQA